MMLITMCGIAGVAGERDPARAVLAARMLSQALSRRGPDGEGLEAWDGAVLAHRRLSIFDLSEAGRQPMLSPDRQTGVVFNGAVYNFRELRRDLESRGFTFTSETDTECLVHGYRAYGIDGLVARMHGMFAFALWDERRRTLYLVRDRLGVKPLLYALEPGRIAFASTARALSDAGFAHEFDDDAVAEFLEFGFVTDDRSIYREVGKLPAAHIGEWSAESGLRIRRYWSAPSADEKAHIAFEEALRETERLLLRAVELRLQADVPVGALLSGGIDSALVCWAIRELGADIRAFTVGAPNDPWDETADAVATAQKLGIRHRVLPLQLRPDEGISTLVQAYGEPFACASALGMLAVSRAVREEATVLLTGDGGDDVFLGYDVHRRLRIAYHLARLIPPGGDALWKRVRGYVPSSSAIGRARHLVDYACGGIGAVALAHDGLPSYQALGIAGERCAAASVTHRAIPWSLDSGRNVLREFLDFHQRTRFVGEYMTKVDGGTMYHGLEARAPFLDQDLWSYAASLPFDLRMRAGTAKAILRELARRKIGERVARGTKRGFGVPVQRWISGPWRKAVDDALSESLLDAAGWIRADRARTVLRNLPDGATAPVQLWYVFVLESWMREHARRQAGLLQKQAV
jgi:asparagine synthase (glutamine-hydrolysing)